MPYLDLDKHPDAQPSKSVPVEEPGWFMPGSKSEAATRGFANAATFGLAPRISAGANALMGNGDFGSNLKQYLAANRLAEAAQPGASLAGAAVPSVIQALARVVEVWVVRRLLMPQWVQ